MDHDQTLRQHVVTLLKGRGAHADFDAAVADFPQNLYGTKPAGAAHTPWQLLEHLRIAQSDILEFTRDPQHVSPKWPEGYWPVKDAPASAKDWERSVEGFRRDAAALEELVSDPEVNLCAPLEHGNGQTVLREALLAADHNAYHVGQLVMLRVIQGAWK